jgi:hypothetical protein
MKSNEVSSAKKWIKIGPNSEIMIIEQYLFYMQNEGRTKEKREVGGITWHGGSLL